MNFLKVINEGYFFGLVNEENKELLPCKYHSVFRINDLLFGYRTGKRWGIIKTNGEIIIPPVLNGLIEQELISDEYENLIHQDKPLSVENPFTHKLNDQYLKQYNGWFIEETMEDYEGENYIISEDNLGKVFICDLQGKILLHEKVDTIWKVDMNSWFVVFKDGYANIWNCRTKKYLLESFLPSNEFYQDQFGQIYFTYNSVDYVIDRESSELTIINTETKEKETNWA